MHSPPLEPIDTEPEWIAHSPKEPVLGFSLGLWCPNKGQLMTSSTVWDMSSYRIQNSRSYLNRVGLGCMTTSTFKGRGRCREAPGSGCWKTGPAVILPYSPPGGIQVLFWVSVGYGRVVDSGQRAQLSRISRMCPHIDYFRYLSSKAQGNHHSELKIFSSKN